MTPPTHTSDTLDEILSEAAKTISVGVVTGNFQNSKTKQKLQHLIEQAEIKARISELERQLVTYNNWPGKYRDGLQETIKVLKAALEQKLGDKE